MSLAGKYSCSSRDASRDLPRSVSPTHRTIYAALAFGAHRTHTCRYLWRRRAADEGLLEEGAKPVGPSAKTDFEGDPAVAYRLGVRTRHTIGASALLGVIERITGDAFDSQDLKGNMGVEHAGHHAHLDNRTVTAFFAAKAAEKHRARQAAGLEENDAGGGAKKGKSKR